MFASASPRDQIAFISSPEIQRRFFQQFFMVDGIDFEKRGALAERERNQMLWQRLSSLNTRKTKEYDNLCTALNIIDIFGSDSRQLDELIDLIRRYQPLYERYLMDEFGEGEDYRRNARNIAAWLYVQKQTSPDGAVKNFAAIIWSIIQSQVAILRQESKTHTFFTPCAFTCPESLGDTFRTRYRQLRIDETGDKNYPVECTTDRFSGGIRLTVSAKKDPIFTVQLNNVDPEKPNPEITEPFKVGLDPNADAFCVYLFPAREYFMVKFLTNNRRVKAVAKLIAEICSTELVSHKGKKYFIHPFANRKALEKLKIESFDASHQNQVWVSALGIERIDKTGKTRSKNIEVDFPLESGRTIYDNIEKVYSSLDDCPIHSVFSLELSFKLFDFDVVEGMKLCHNNPKIKKLHLTPHSNNFDTTFKDVNPELKQLARACLANANLKALTKEEYNLQLDKANEL